MLRDKFENAMMDDEGVGVEVAVLDTVVAGNLAALGGFEFTGLVSRLSQAHQMDCRSDGSAGWCQFTKAASQSDISADDR